MALVLNGYEPRPIWTNLWSYLLLTAKWKCWPNKSVAAQDSKKTISMLLPNKHVGRQTHTWHGLWFKIIAEKVEKNMHLVQPDWQKLTQHWLEWVIINILWRSFKVKIKYLLVFLSNGKSKYTWDTTYLRGIGIFPFFFHLFPISKSWFLWKKKG